MILAIRTVLPAMALLTMAWGDGAAQAQAPLPAKAPSEPMPSQPVPSAQPNPAKSPPPEMTPAKPVWVSIGIMGSGNGGEGSEYLGRIPAKVFAGLLDGTHHGLVPVESCCYLGEQGELNYLDDLDAAYSSTAYFPAQRIERIIPLRQPTIDRITNRKL